MPASTPNVSAAAQSRLSQAAMLFHIGKTASLVSAIMKDTRVHWLPKFSFFGVLGALLVALLFPEAIADVSGLFAPVLGWAFDAVGIPAEATLDWAVLGVVAFNLLKLFPKEIVGEHYDRLFRK
jgi:hypothetical protein